MYVEFMKNFNLVDSNKLIAVRLISAFWAPKTFDPYFVHMMYIDFIKKFTSPIRTNRFGLLSPKRFDSYFLYMVYVEFMKNIHVVDSNEVMVVTLISACSAQKRLIPTF